MSPREADQPGALDAGLWPAKKGSSLPSGTAHSSPTSSQWSGGSSRQKRYSGSISRFKVDDFDVVASLGEGTFSKVTQCVHKGTGVAYAMKRIPKRKLLQHSGGDSLAREVKTQLRVVHSNILRLHYYFEDADHVQLLLELALGGSLHALLQQGPLSEPEAARYFLNVADALDHLHSSRVAYRGLKPAGILICDKDVAKLANFGCCAEVDKDGIAGHSFCGPWDYMSPEMVQKEPHGLTVDIWAIGVLLFEMLTTEVPFAAENQMTTLMRIANVDAQYPDEMPVLARDLIEKLLVKDRKGRLPLKEASTHAWALYNLQPEVQCRHSLTTMLSATRRSKSATTVGSDTPDVVVAQVGTTSWPRSCGDAPSGTSINDEISESETFSELAQPQPTFARLTTDEFRIARDEASSDGRRISAESGSAMGVRRISAESNNAGGIRDELEVASIASGPQSPVMTPSSSPGGKVFRMFRKRLSHRHSQLEEEKNAQELSRQRMNVDLGKELAKTVRVDQEVRSAPLGRRQALKQQHWHPAHLDG